MKIIILDRDGVINQDSDNFIKTVDEFIPLAGSIEAIAKTSNHSPHTIRSQLKSTFKKTGVSRQSELIKLLLTGPFAHRRRSNNG